MQEFRRPIHSFVLGKGKKIQMKPTIVVITFITFVFLSFVPAVKKTKQKFVSIYGYTLRMQIYTQANTHLLPYFIRQSCFI
jgi:hypothetical protein